jgi:hypothetical protein
MNAPDAEINASSRNGHGEPIEEGDRSKTSSQRANGHGERDDPAPEDAEASQEAKANGHGEPDRPGPVKRPN